MLKRVIRIIGYGILLLGAAALLWFFHGFLNLIMLVVLVFLPVLSILSARWIFDRLEAEWEGPYETMQKGEEFLLRLRLKNPLWLGAMHCEACVTVENRYYRSSRRHELQVPIRARTGQMVTYPVTAEQCGNIEFRLEEIRLEDFLGLAVFRRSCRTVYAVTVLPGCQTQLEAEMGGYTRGMREVEESSQAGSDFSEVQDVREYRPGDRLQNIHWKLSAKRELLMVKERLSMSSKQLLVLPELHDNGDGLMEEVFDCADGILRLMLSQKQPVALVWWSAQTQELKTWKVERLEQLEEGFRMIYYESMYAEPALGRAMLRAVQGEETQFLWLGDRAQGEGEAFMEYGKGAGVYYGVQT